MEDPLYLRDCYLKEFDAEVVKADGKYIVLDNTAFYPQSGGQPWDEGVMVRDDGKEFRVVFVGKFSGSISHEVDQEGLRAGDKVRCSIDWDRRYKLMKSHTAAHIISEVIHKETGAMITGNQLGVDKNRIDFSVQDFDGDKLQSYEDKANEVVRQGIELSYEYKSREEVLKDPEMTKLAKGIEALPDVKNFRIVRIGDFDYQADGGTHVKNTSEIGGIRFVDFVNKGSKNRRVYFTVS
jgi:misacylated tRNA(Ala) deacylase